MVGPERDELFPGPRALSGRAGDLILLVWAAIREMDVPRHES